LYVSKHADQLVRCGIDVTLVDPDRFWYSGLATGMLGGLYDAEQDQVDAGRLIESRGGRFVRDRLIALDRPRSTVHLESGLQISYDAVSINVGSEVAIAHVPGAETYAWPVKPTSNLWRLRQHLETRFLDRTHPTRVIVAGGGASGCEVAANIDALARRHQAPVEIMVISRSQRLLSRHSGRVSRRATAELQRRRVMVSDACSIDEATPGRVICSDGRRPEFDVLVVATGLRAPEVVSRLGLPLGDKGGLLVRRSLQSVNDPTVLAVGDCADLRGHALERFGVFAVRQSPVLLHNLKAIIRGSALAEFRPQRRWLSILNLGEGQGLALWGPLSWKGRLALWLKDRIDRRFLAQYHLSRMVSRDHE
jgi:NADH dehydrogenase FAD-containing subunit